MATLSEVKRDYGRVKNYVNGQWIHSSSSELLDVVNPATGETIAQVPMSTPVEVEEAIQAAKAAFQGWRETPPMARIQHLFHLKNLMEEHFEEIARTITQEMGKTIAEARGEVRRSIETVEGATSIPILMKGRNLEDISRGIDEEEVRQPLGVFCMVAPFNFPTMVPMWFLPYALACGNTYIVKPSEQAPLGQNLLFTLLEEAGFPPGVVNLVNGRREVVDALLESPDVKGVSFVGSTPVARYIYSKAAAHGKRAQCQAGAKNFLVVMPDADLGRTIDALLDSFYGCAGQRCLAGSVLLAVGDIYEPLKTKFVDASSALKVGYGLDESINMGPVVSQRAKERVLGYIDKGVKEGAQLLLDGRKLKVTDYPKGSFVGPTVFDQSRPDMTIAREEIFGPVVSLMHVRDFEEALKLIDANPYGNAASIFTSSGKWAREFKHRVTCGNIGINIGIAAPVAPFPFSGMKDSFFGDLHGQGEDASTFFTERKVVITRW